MHDVGGAIDGGCKSLILVNDLIFLYLHQMVVKLIPVDSPKTRPRLTRTPRVPVLIAGCGAARKRKVIEIRVVISL